MSGRATGDVTRVTDELPTRPCFFTNPTISPVFKTIVLFGSPFVLLAAVIAAIWLLSYFTNGVSATVIVLGELPLAGAIVAFVFRKIELKVFLGALLIFGLITNLQAIIGGVVWLIRGY
jgi:hypothetical protein